MGIFYGSAVTTSNCDDIWATKMKGGTLPLYLRRTLGHNLQVLVPYPKGDSKLSTELCLSSSIITSDHTKYQRVRFEAQLGPFQSKCDITVRDG